jgi:NitT/TauT family transport system ATP-binding protein
VLLELNTVDFGYANELLLLDGFDLRVAQGEFVALLGPSGCGKSTLLNLAAGLMAPQAGQVRFAGRDLRGINRDVGYMTQGDTLLPWVSVARNIALPLELRGMGAAERRERVDRVIETVNLAEARDKYPSELSGGMRRRALLARSIVYDPPMLLMDEPFGALDAQLREKMQAELLATVARTGQSVLFVTHDIAESILLADRILVLGGMPLRAMEEIAVPFGHGRNLEDIRISEAYHELELHLRGVLRAADAATNQERSAVA